MLSCHIIRSRPLKPVYRRLSEIVVTSSPSETSKTFRKPELLNRVLFSALTITISLSELVFTYPTTSSDLEQTETCLSENIGMPPVLNGPLIYMQLRRVCRIGLFSFNCLRKTTGQVIHLLLHMKVYPAKNNKRFHEATAKIQCQKFATGQERMCDVAGGHGH